jgi:hypothetical protein
MTVEPLGSTKIRSNPTTGHDPKPVLTTSQPVFLKSVLMSNFGLWGLDVLYVTTRYGFLA